jgi:hypothetical protein
MRWAFLARANTSGVDFVESCDGRASSVGPRMFRKVHQRFADAPLRLRAATPFRRIGPSTAAAILLNSLAGRVARPFEHLTNRRVPLDKSEGPVKNKLSLSMPGHRNVRQRR